MCSNFWAGQQTHPALHTFNTLPLFSIYRVTFIYKYKKPKHESITMQAILVQLEPQLRQYQCTQASWPFIIPMGSKNGLFLSIKLKSRARYLFFFFFCVKLLRVGNQVQISTAQVSVTRVANCSSWTLALYISCLSPHITRIPTSISKRN